MSLDRFCFENGLVPIEKVDADIPIVRGTLCPTFKRIQFPSALSWAYTIHRVQGLSVEQGAVSFDLKKQNSFGPGQMYATSSRVTNYDQLYCIGEYKMSSIKVNTSALDAMDIASDKRLMRIFYVSLKPKYSRNRVIQMI